MYKHCHIVWLALLSVFPIAAQEQDEAAGIRIKGSVKTMESNTPIKGVEISTRKGAYAVTNSLGEFSIRVAVGDELVIESPQIETLRYRVLNDEEIEVLVKDIENNGRQSRAAPLPSAAGRHQSNLDSARFYRKSDIAKSIDFVAQSIAVLGNSGNKKELAQSLTALGEIYQYYKQYDLAIANYVDAQESYKSSATAVLLGRAYILNGDYADAVRVLEPLLAIRELVPYQRIEVLEGLGDANRGLGSIDTAVAYYRQGLAIADQNQIAPKLPDLNSKIADALAGDNRLQEAEGFYNNSLSQASTMAPQRAVQEKEKVADFYNKRSQFDDEITLRKKSLQELKGMARSKIAKGSEDGINDSISAQRINYKIANAYIAQDKLGEAIPYLMESISEADQEDDLIVQKDATRKLSEVYKQQGNFSRALETYQKYVAVVDTLYIRKEQEIARAARFNREIAAKQSRISGLEQERELSQSKYDLALTEQQLAQEANKRQKWLIYSLIVGMLLTGLAAFFLYRSMQQQKLANNLLALKSLRSQMNPHFIFNALNSVNNYIAKSDERSANRFLSDFSTLMRAVLENSEEDFIPLSRELELLTLYVRLEHSRFPEKFDYKIDIDDGLDTDAFLIPPMLLQPYIENAIWHGLRYKEEKGNLWIRVVKTDSRLITITITDDGIGRKLSGELKTAHQKQQKSKGMGMITRRIAILNDMYRDTIHVSVEDLNTDQTGTRVTLTLKKS